MSKRELPNSNISYPWDEGQSSSPRVICPYCKNDGQDGSITSKGNQWGMVRLCTKCGKTFGGSIGVQRADLSEPPPVPGVDTEEQEPPRQNLDPPHVNPNKNVSKD